MFDVIDVLELLGSDADLAGGPSAGLDAMLQREGVEPAMRAALREGDAGLLRALLRTPDDVCALIHTVEEEEEEGEEQDEEGEDEGDDDEDAVPASRPRPTGG